MTTRGERGLTLMEVTIVMALAALVVMGMIGFYISSQATWMDGSTQAITQRDATLLVETLSENVRQAAFADVTSDPDSVHRTLTLFRNDGTTMRAFWWSPGDSLVHQGPAAGQDAGPVVASKVTRFQLDTLTNMVTIRLVELRAGDGQLVRMASAARLCNRWTPTP